LFLNKRTPFMTSSPTDSTLKTLESRLTTLAEKTLPKAAATGLSSINKEVQNNINRSKTSFDDFGRSLRASLERSLTALAQTAINQAAASNSGGGGQGGIGSLLGNLFGGARAKGGPVTAGQAYLVGEQGPELFVPGSSGGIVPNGALRPGAAVNAPVVNVTITTPDAGSFLASRRQVEAALAGAVRRGSGGL
jgi:phage-related minor tail protein